MRKKHLFSDATQYLLYASIFAAVFHQISYGFIQNWSLYRSIVFSTDPCRIMFNEYECYPFYVGNIYIRLTIMFINCSLTFDRLFSSITRTLRAGTFHVPVLIVVTMLSSAYFSWFLTKDGPKPYILGNCLQRLNRDIGELTFTVLLYFAISCICLFLNILVLCFNIRHPIGNKYNLDSRYSKQEAMHSTTVVSILSIIQMVSMGIYSLGVIFFIKYPTSFDPITLSNLVLWVYAVPYGALSLPIGLLMYSSWVSKKRRRTIHTLTSLNKPMELDKYFRQLKDEWN